MLQLTSRSRGRYGDDFLLQRACLCVDNFSAAHFLPLELLLPSFPTAGIKVPIFRILLLTASSDNFGLKTKVGEEILAEPHALKFLKSLQGEPSYDCLKFARGFVILRPKIRVEVLQRF